MPTLRQMAYLLGGDDHQADDLVQETITKPDLARTPRPTLPDLPPDPVVPAACTVDVLPMGRHTSAEVSAGDPAGTWLAGLSDPHYSRPAVPRSLLVWRDGELVADVKSPDGGVRMTGVNASGVAVGAYDLGTDYPYVYRNGQIRKLAGGPGQAVAINDAGVIVGQLGPADKGEAGALGFTRSGAAAGVARGGRPGVDAGPGHHPGRDGLRGDSVRRLPVVTGRRRPLPQTVAGGRRARGVGFRPSAFPHGWLYGDVPSRWRTTSTSRAASATSRERAPGSRSAGKHRRRRSPPGSARRSTPGDPL